MYKVVFIGSNPSNKSASVVPFWHDAKSTIILKQWMSKIYEDVGSMESIHFLNVCNSPTPNNRPLKSSEIKSCLPNLKKKIEVDIIPDRVVALGKAAEKALTLLGIQHYAMPHPSGLNRKLNDPAYIEEKINGLKEYLQPI